MKIKSTKIPKERLYEPYSMPTMEYIVDYWTVGRRSFNYEHYLKILRLKKVGYEKKFTDCMEEY